MATMFQSMTAAAQPTNGLGLFQKTADRFNNPKFRAGVGTVAGGLATIARGRAEAANAEVDAIGHELDAKREELAGRNEVLNLTRALNQDLAQILSSSGASEGGGGAGFQASIREAFSINRENKSNSEFQTSRKSAVSRENARQSRFDGRLSKLNSYVDAGFQGLDYFDRKRKRG